MPSPQKFYKRDPDGKARGAGFYYTRTIARGSRRVHVHSKYSPMRDAKYHIKHGVAKPHLPEKYAHTGDTHRDRKIYKRAMVSPRKTKKLFGWF